MPKNKQQIEKKQELEIEIEIVNKNIQNLRQKLREMNAFWFMFNTIKLFNGNL